MFAYIVIMKCIFMQIHVIRVVQSQFLQKYDSVQSDIRIIKAIVTILYLHSYKRLLYDTSK